MTKSGQVLDRGGALTEGAVSGSVLDRGGAVNGAEPADPNEGNANQVNTYFVFCLHDPFVLHHNDQSEHRTYSVLFCARMFLCMVCVIFIFFQLFEKLKN